MAYQGSTEAGTAVADAIFGKINLSGKLSMTWPSDAAAPGGDFQTGAPSPLGDEPKFFDQLPGTNSGQGSGYNPLYAFGFGLSYTGSLSRPGWQHDVRLHRELSTTVGGGVAPGASSDPHLDTSHQKVARARGSVDKRQSPSRSATCCVTMARTSASRVRSRQTVRRIHETRSSRFGKPPRCSDSTTRRSARYRFRGSPPAHPASPGRSVGPGSKSAARGSAPAADSADESG